MKTLMACPEFDTAVVTIATGGASVKMKTEEFLSADFADFRIEF
jgi:hypothetical protein